MRIFCVGCQQKVEARLTNGKEIYPHRPDLYDLPFWKCDTCKNYVGTHHKTDSPTKPLGCIPTKQILAKRKEIHALLDPLWKNGVRSRKDLYNAISGAVGFRYHTGQIRSVEEADKVLEFIKKRFIKQKALNF